MKKDDWLLIDDKKDNPQAGRVARTMQAGLDAIQEQKWELILLDYDLGEIGHTGMKILEFLRDNPQHRPEHIWLNSGWAEGVRMMQKFMEEHMPEVRCITRLK